MRDELNGITRILSTFSLFFSLSKVYDLFSPHKLTPNGKITLLKKQKIRNIYKENWLYYHFLLLSIPCLFFLSPCLFIYLSYSLFSLNFFSIRSSFFISFFNPPFIRLGGTEYSMIENRKHFYSSIL